MASNLLGSTQLEIAFRKLKEVFDQENQEAPFDYRKAIFGLGEKSNAGKESTKQLGLRNSQTSGFEDDDDQ